MASPGRVFVPQGGGYSGEVGPGVRREGTGHRVEIKVPTYLYTCLNIGGGGGKYGPNSASRYHIGLH
jgi:hypothetical protein